MAVRGDNSLFFSTGIDNSGLLRGKADAVGIIQSLGTKISKINPFAALAVGAVAAFTLIANEGYKMSRSFESAMAEVRTIANVSDKDFEKLEQSVFSIYKRLGTEAPDKLANGLYEIIGAGFEAGEALKVLEISSKAATAGVTSTQVAADGLTTILNSFKLTANEAQESADIMFATVDRGKISFEELSSQIATVAPLAAASNISFREVGGAIATLTKQGVPASMAMTQIRSAIIATNEVLGDGAFDVLTMQEAFQKMFEMAGGSQNKLKELAGRIEAVNGIISIAGDNFKGASEDLDAMADSAGSVDKSFNIITSTNANQWEIFKNRIKATTKDIGGAVLSMSTSIVGGLNTAFDALEGVTDETIKQASKFRLLRNELNSSNTSFDRKIEILKELKTEYPEYLKSLNLDKITNNNLNDVLQKVKTSLQEINEEHKKRIELSAYNLDVVNAQKEVDIQEKTLERAKIRFSKAVKKINEEAGEKGIEFNFSLADDPSVIINELKEKFPEFQFDIFNDLIKSADFIKRQKEDLRKANEELEKVNGSLSIQQRKLYDNENGYKKIVAQISKIKTLEGLDQFNDFKFSKITDSVKKRKEIITDLNQIGAVTTKQYIKNKNILKEYLESENEEIKKAAEKRKAFFEFKPNPGGKKDDRTVDEKFADNLRLKQEQFKHYNLAIKNNDDELAKSLKEKYKLKEEDYVDYLRNLYKITKTDGHKALILESLDKQGTALNPREKAVALPSLKAATINLDFKIDTTSINAIQRRLSKLIKDYEKAQTDAERKLISNKIKAEDKKLKAAEIHLKKEKSLYGDLSRTINSLSFKELRIHIKNLKQRLKIEKLTAKEIIKIRGQIAEAEESIGDKIQNTSNDIAKVLGDVGSIFRKFGDEDTAKLLDQLAGVAEGVGQIGKGIATGNPLDIISGGLKVLESGLTVEVVSDTSKFEKAIKELEKAIDKLDYVISKSIGGDKIGNRKGAIKDLEDLEKQADLALDAEKKARKQVKFLGVKLWEKGSGSGTSPEKLEELEQKAEDARRKAQELKEQLDELYTGTTQTTIVDSIISGLKEGNRSVADFADNFKELMQDALLQAFQIKYLEKEIEKFYEAFAAAGSDSNYTAEEINALQNLYNSMILGAQDDIDAINKILQDSGIGTLGSNSNQSGLAGSISTITEDTANVLAGTLNSIRIDISTGLSIAVENTQLLSKIANNTSYNKHLENLDQMNYRLGEIETLLR